MVYHSSISGIFEMWVCDVFEYKNPYDEDICEECGSYREETAYDAIADEDDE